MSDEVGYGKPPRHSQFPKGRSGNPKGRPKGSGTLEKDLQADLNKKIPYTENGKTRKITKQRALVMSLNAAAIKGDTRAAALVLNLRMRLSDGQDVSANLPLSSEDLAILDQFVKSSNNTGTKKP